MKVNTLKGTLLFIAFTCVFLALEPTAIAVDDHGDNPDHATPLSLNEWTDGEIGLEDSSDWFSFEGEVNKNYEFSLVLDELPALETTDVYRYFYASAFISSSNNPYTPIQTANSLKAGDDVQLCFLLPSTGTFLIHVSGNIYGITKGRYHVKVSTYDSNIELAKGYLREGKTAQALSEFQSLLSNDPGNAELVFYVNFLKAIDLADRHDPALSRLITLFGLQVDFLPNTVITLPEVFPTTAPSLEEVQTYCVQTLLPFVEERLKEISMVDINTIQPFQLTTGLQDCAPIVEVDASDFVLLKGALHALKAAIYLLAAFNIDIDSNILEEGIRTHYTPQVVNFLVKGSPKLLRGNEDVSARLRAALENWLEATKNLREGINMILSEADFQADDFLSVEAEPAQYGLAGLTLFDRIFESLLSVTGGDLNSDDSIDVKDLLVLQSLWYKK